MTQVLPTLSDDDCFLETKEAAKFIGISPHTLATWRRKDYNGPRKENGPPFYKIANNTIVYLKSELVAWMWQHRTTPTITPTQAGEQPRHWD